MKLPFVSNSGVRMPNRSSTVSNTSCCRYSARSTIETGTEDFTISGTCACSGGNFMPGGIPWNSRPSSINDSP
ncbi:MAG TPA: hypothetical protein VIB01_01745 [Steroidobacteraceae bacterium]